MLYKVAITETRRRIVAVDAATPTEAHRRASDAWHNGEVVLRDEDFEGIEAFVMGELQEVTDEYRIEGKDCY